MARPRFVALVTDFGLADVYVGVVRSVIRTLAPESEVLDICHAVAPGDVHEGAFFLVAAVPFLPKGTIHLCVVDPGVGSARRAVAVRAGGHTFVGPDNGVLAPIVEALGGIQEARVLSNVKLQRPARSRTFDGRDVFAPVCAHLVRGIDFALVGDAATAIEPLPGFAPQTGPDRCEGRILHVDRFGNLVTNFVASDLGGGPETWRLELCGGEGAASHSVARWGGTFADVAAGEPLAYVGSAGFVEIAVRDASAADRFGAGRATPVAAVRRSP